MAKRICWPASQPIRPVPEGRTIYGRWQMANRNMKKTRGVVRTKRLEVLNSHMVDLTVSSWGGVGMSWYQVRRCRRVEEYYFN